jgi:hypothetical protein
VPSGVGEVRNPCATGGTIPKPVGAVNAGLCSTGGGAGPFRCWDRTGRVSGNRAGDPSQGGKVAKVAKVAHTHPSGISTPVQYTHPNTERP